MYTTCLNVSNEYIISIRAPLPIAKFSFIGPHCKKHVCGTAMLETAVNQCTLSDGTVSILITPQPSCSSNLNVNEAHQLLELLRN